MAGLNYFLEMVYNEGKQADEYRLKKEKEARDSRKQEKKDLATQKNRLRKQLKDMNRDIEKDPKGFDDKYRKASEKMGHTPKNSNARINQIRHNGEDNSTNAAAINKFVSRGRKEMKKIKESVILNPELI